MASDDNVVKLKHLQPFAKVVSIPNGDNVLRLKHLVSLASAIADESTSKQHVLSLGSWSSADSIYSAEIFYDGDGTLSTDIGSISNGILTVEDDDGCFSGTITITNKLNFSVNTPHLIDSFSVTPNEITIYSGASTTAEIQITTTPDNVPYQLSTPDAPEWVSIDGTTISFAPPTGTQSDTYSFNVVATTKDDSKECTVTLTVNGEKLSPSFQFKSPNPLPFTNSSYVGFEDNYTAVINVDVYYLGSKRGITITGTIPWLVENGTFKSQRTPTYGKTGTNKYRITLGMVYSNKVSKIWTTSNTNTNRIKFTLAEDNTYKEETITLQFDYSVTGGNSIKRTVT